MQDDTGTRRVIVDAAFIHAPDPASRRTLACPCVRHPYASPLGLHMAGPSLARADPQGISTNVPVQLDDAFPSVGFGEKQFQFDSRYTLDQHNSNGRDLVGAGSTLKVGALPHLQLSFNPGYDLGNQGGTDGGSASASAMWAVRGDSRWGLPRSRSAAATPRPTARTTNPRNGRTPWPRPSTLAPARRARASTST
ncbi:MAG: hypothetical protein ACRYG8_12055 [Janthinobacterium lividum]